MNKARMFRALMILLYSLSLGATKVKVGADMLLEKYFNLIEGKRVGLVTNHSAVLSDGRLLADALHENNKTALVALFGPEHGVRGDAPAGAVVQNEKDPKTGVPVYSLYGSTTKPTSEMLKGIEVLLFDIQDVGVRFYTFESTLSVTMEAAAENDIPFIVLDRPNPIRGTWIEGFVRDDSLRSFVGWNPTPIAHGMTLGELATMINEEHWLKNGLKANLTVVRMDGWRRNLWFDETGLRWIRPSPNLPALESAIVYPGTCFFEGTNLSEGRGTLHPFEEIGAPFVDGNKWANMLNQFRLPGVQFSGIRFTPDSIPNVVHNPKYRGIECGGIRTEVTDRNVYEPVKTAVCMLSTARLLFPKDFRWKTDWIDKLAGTPLLRQSIESGLSPDRIAEKWKEDVDRFGAKRRKYLLY